MATAAPETSEAPHERSPTQTPEEHAAEIIGCWIEVGLLKHDHRLGSYRSALAEDIRVAEGRGASRANTDLLAALKALLPEGWGDDDTMDHMPGVKLARLAIAKTVGR